MLADLRKGIATIMLKAYPDDPGDFSFASLDFSTEEEIFTVKDSFAITEGDPTTEDLQIDQMNEIIESMVTEGEYSMTGQVPSNAKALYDYFYESGAAITGIKGKETTYTGQAYKAKKEVYCSVLVESESKKTAVAFARVRLVLSRPVLENSSTVGYATLNGYILANLGEGGNFAVLNNGTPTAAG